MHLGKLEGFFFEANSSVVGYAITPPMAAFSYLGATLVSGFLGQYLALYLW